MANNNVQNVRFLRNGSLYATREAALTGLNGQTLAAEQDGSIILARYGSGNTVKTLVGLVYVNSENKSLTIFDIEGASGDVEKLRQEINAKLGDGITSTNTATAQLTALSGSASDTSATTSVAGAKAYAKDYTDEQISSLDYTDTAVTGSYVSAVNEVDGRISVSRVALPDASSVADDNKVVTDVTQSKGAITATASNITGIKLAGYAEGTDADIAATDTLGQALGKLQAQINAMDKNASAVDGQVVTTVSEDDGKVTETKTNVKDLQLGGYAKNTSATGAIASTDTVNEALSKLENKAAAITIASADKTVKVTTASTGTDISVNIDGTTLIKNASTGVISSDLKIVSIEQGTGSTYASQYQLVYGDSNQPIGDIISVGKDQFLKEADYDPETQKLVLTMWNSTGGTTDIEVDFSEAVIEAEAGEGLYVKADHSLNVGVASSSETVTISDGAGGSTEAAVLSVNADNIEVQNIQKAIDYKVSTLDADLSGNTTHVKVGVAEADGKITAVTVDETDIASKSLLDEISGKAVTAVAMTGGTANIVDNDSDGTKKITINTDGSQIFMTGYAKGSDSGAVATSDSINVAIGKLENQIASKVDALDATVSGQTADGKVKVQVVQENGVLTAVTVTGTDIASDSALTAEITARKAVDGQSGQTYAANTSSSYINNAISLNDADVKLAAALKTLDDDAIKSVKVNNTTLSETSGAVGINISAVAGTGSDTPAIVVNTANNGDVTLQINYIDAGVYDAN